MKLLITGASGFIGTHLIRELSKQDEILAIDIIEPQIKNSNIKFLKADITNINDLKSVINTAPPDLENISENQKNDVPSHFKGCGLIGTRFLDAWEQQHPKGCGFQS